MGAGGWYYVPKVRILAMRGAYVFMNKVQRRWRRVCWRRTAFRYECISPLCFFQLLSHLNWLMQGLDSLRRLVGRPKTLEEKHRHGWCRDWFFLHLLVYSVDRAGTSPYCSSISHSLPKMVQICQSGRSKSVNTILTHFVAFNSRCGRYATNNKTKRRFCGTILLQLQHGWESVVVKVVAMVLLRKRIPFRLLHSDRIRP